MEVRKWERDKRKPVPQAVHIGEEFLLIAAGTRITSSIIRGTKAPQRNVKGEGTPMIQKQEVLTLGTSTLNHSSDLSRLSRFFRQKFAEERVKRRVIRGEILERLRLGSRY